MEISAEKTKLITNNNSGINKEIKINGQKLETVTSFKYLVSVVSYQGSKPKIPSRIAQTTAALTSLNPVKNDWSISLSSKIRLMYSFVTSIFLYAFGIMDLHDRSAKRNTSHGNEVLPQDTTHLIQKPCYLRGSPCQDPAGNRTTRRPPDYGKETQTSVISHVFRSSGLAKTILQGTVKGGRRQGRQRERWEDNIREWTGLEFTNDPRR